MTAVIYALNEQLTNPCKRYQDPLNQTGNQSTAESLIHLTPNPRSKLKLPHLELERPVRCCLPNGLIESDEGRAGLTCPLFCGFRFGSGMGWDGMGWDGMGWHGMAWDGMAWDGMGKVKKRKRKGEGEEERGRERNRDWGVGGRERERKIKRKEEKNKKEKRRRRRLGAEQKRKWKRNICLE